MRSGFVFRRCTRCGSRVSERRCACGSDSLSWAFTVDVAPVGAPKREQRKRQGFATKAAALDAMAKLQKEKSEGTHVEPSKLTVKDYLASWLAGGAGGHIRPTTLKTYDVAVRVHITPRIGSVPLQQLTRAQVKALYHDLQIEGYAKGKEKVGTPLSSKSVHNIALALRKALADAVTEGALRSNPADAGHKLSTERPEMQTWTSDELRRFLAAVAHDERLHPLWRVASMTGMRRGEVLGLRWRDLTGDFGGINLQQQLVRAGQTVTFGAPKTKAGRRAISLDPGTAAALEKLHQRQAKDKMKWGEAYATLDLVFCHPNGRPYDPDVITHQFGLACSRARVKTIRLHDLRHTHATLLLQANVHPKVVQERLGHSSIMVTLDRYSHVLPTMQIEAAAKLGGIVDSVLQAS